MFPVFHSAAAVALNNYSADFIAGCMAPDLHIAAPYLFRFMETHDTQYLKKVLPRFKNKDFALGFVTHAYVFDPISHGYATAQEFNDFKAGLRQHNFDVLQRGYAFRQLSEKFPRIRQLGAKINSHLDCTTELVLELWAIKYHPEIQKVSERFSEADLGALIPDIAQAFGKPEKKVAEAVRLSSGQAYWFNQLNRLLAPLASSGRNNSRQACLEQCIAECRKRFDNGKSLEENISI